MNTTQRTRPKRKNKARRGLGCFGSMILLAVGLLCGGVGNYIYEHGFDQALEDWKGLFQEDAKPVVQNPSTGGRVIIAEPMDLRPLYEQDPRWEPTVKKGEEGRALFEFAIKEQYGEHGDPFLFRSRMSDAAKMMEEALQSLQEMRDDYADNKISVLAIDAMATRFSGSLKEYDTKMKR